MKHDGVPRLSDCPRCGFRAFEFLETYAHCVDCNYHEEIQTEAGLIPQWALDFLAQSTTQSEMRCV